MEDFVVIEARLKTGWTKEDALEHKKGVIRMVEAVGRVPNWSSVPIASELQAVVDYVLWELPNRQFDPLFENLFYEDDIKTELLSFVQSVINLSRLGVDTNVIDLNRLILLHGPPGTGKTTFCKALAQRLAWFSESGKLVQKLFDQIGDLASEKKWLVVVLVDEVESLVMGRNVSSAEPTDAVRAVNAVLTQIDKIRSYSNVLAAGRILLRALAEFARLGILSDFDEEKAAEQLGALVPADSKKSNIKTEEFVAALRQVLDEAAERRP
ncbi:AAA domain-containing protein [Aphelenchoides fujianensis]|nr:AAA domain-containing protein [Aphelenchoides fujianensis]